MNKFEFASRIDSLELLFSQMSSTHHQMGIYLINRIRRRRRRSQSEKISWMNLREREVEDKEKVEYKIFVYV